MVDIKPGFEKTISEDLTLKIASSKEEGEKLASFNAEVHGEEFEEYVTRLYFNHPNKENMLWFYIIDVTQGLVISSLAMLPLKWKIMSTEIPVAEMGFVGTRESHRGQGLFSILNNHYEAALAERNISMSVLVGIPNFYRKFGYIFALNRYSGYSIPTNNIPQNQIEEVKVRKATEDDISEIEEFYTKLNEKYVVSTSFDKEKFNFRLMNNTCDTLNSISYIVEEGRKPVGFFSIGSLSDPNQADIILSSDLTYNQMIKVLQFVKTYNLGTIQSFNVNVHPMSKFAEFLKSLGSTLSNNWPWQVQIPDMKRFFECIKPVLEQRVNQSIFRNLSREVKISNYTDTITLQFKDGEIEDITVSKEFPSFEVDLRIPNPHYIRLFLSDRDVKEINHIITDTQVKSSSKLLIKTLFPRQPSIPFSFYQ